MRQTARETRLGQRSMNASTLLRIAEAFYDERGRVDLDCEVYVLTIGSEAGTWPTTVYKACGLGYLKRSRERAWFAATEKLAFEIERIRLRQEEWERAH